MITYRSTRDPKVRVPGFRAACWIGQPADGGLFVPEDIPRIELYDLYPADFLARAIAVLTPWLTPEFTSADIATLCRTAFDFPVPLVRLDADTTLVELFHGPTAAFKDFGARFLARVMAGLRADGQPLTVLVATSGDTGAAVASAFASIADARVVLLYPNQRVSPEQERLLTAVPENTLSCRVDGTFDDCQAMIRAALADPTLVEQLGLVAANSIHIARLLPQMTYALHAAVEWVGAAATPQTGMPGKHRPSPEGDGLPLLVVPAGNLGNLTAALLARRMGAPIAQILAATNRNDALVRALATGRLESQAAVATPSNAMDVGRPSNWERIAALYGNDWRGLRRDVVAESIDDESTLTCMQRIHETHGRFVCPHTAVGLAALRMHRLRRGDRRHALVFATAHPAKFGTVVEVATGHVPPPPPALAGGAGPGRTAQSLRADPAALVALLRRWV